MSITIVDMWQYKDLYCYIDYSTMNMVAYVCLPEGHSLYGTGDHTFYDLGVYDIIEDMIEDNTPKYPEITWSSFLYINPKKFMKEGEMKKDLCKDGEEDDGWIKCSCLGIDFANLVDYITFSLGASDKDTFEYINEQKKTYSSNFSFMKMYNYCLREFLEGRVDTDEKEWGNIFTTGIFKIAKDQGLGSGYLYNSKDNIAFRIEDVKRKIDIVAEACYIYDNLSSKEKEELEKKETNGD